VPHNSVVPVPRRPLTEEEDTWVRDIVSINPDWADVSLGQLYVIEKCICGCRTVVFEEPPFVQNPKVSHQQDAIGQIDIHISADSGHDYISVLLHHSWGKLRYLEVVWYNFPKPVPAYCMELGREVKVGG